MVSKDFAIIIVIIIVIVIVNIFMFIKIQKQSKNNIKENFSSDDLAKVRTEINKIYDMDVEAIRNLGHISKSLLTGTNYHSTAPGTPGDLTIPATNTKFKGNISVDGTITMGHSQMIYTPSGNMHLHGEEELYLLNKKGVYISKAGIGNGNLTVDGNINMANGGTLQSTGTMHITGGEKLYLLNRQGVHIGKNLDGNGNLTVDGDIKIGNTTIRSDGRIYQSRNSVRFIRVGTRYNGLNARKNYWTIRELVVYDIEGNNVALNKPVKINAGSALSPSKPENIVNGRFVDRDDWHNDYHAINNNNMNELEIDLGQEYNLEQIVLYNRHHHEWSDRLNGTTIELLNKDKLRTRLIHTGNWDHAFSKEYLL